MYRALEHRKGVETLLNVGPCTHKGCGFPFDPTEEPPGVDNIEAQELQFFQRHLMGMEVPSLPRVRLYVQQAGAYIETTAWPPKESATRRYYVGAQGISPRRPAESSAAYLTNPAAGLSMSFDQQGTVADQPVHTARSALGRRAGAHLAHAHRCRLRSRSAGPIALHLVAASTAPDTDWFAKISDVAPDGSQSIVSEGQLRASLRALARKSTPKEPLESLASPEAIVPGSFYDYEIALAPTAYRLAAGHQLQLRLTSYNMPNALPGTIDFNGQAPAASSFTPLVPATNTVRFGGADGTSLRLPVSGASSP